MGYEYIRAEFIKDLLHSDEELGRCGDGNIVNFKTAGRNVEEIYGMPGIIDIVNSQSVDLYEAIASQWHLVLGLSCKKPWKTLAYGEQRRTSKLVANLGLI
jgi:hypothetical protein